MEEFHSSAAGIAQRNRRGAKTQSDRAGSASSPVSRSLYCRRQFPPVGTCRDTVRRAEITGFSLRAAWSRHRHWLHYCYGIVCAPSEIGTHGNRSRRAAVPVQFDHLVARINGRSNARRPPYTRRRSSIWLADSRNTGESSRAKWRSASTRPRAWAQAPGYPGGTMRAPPPVTSRTASPALEATARPAAMASRAASRTPRAGMGRRIRRRWRAGRAAPCRRRRPAGAPGRTA